MQIEYRLTLKDYQEANQTHYESLRFWYFLNWIFSILLILLGILSILLLSQKIGVLVSFLLGCFWLFMGVFVNPYLNLYQRYFVSRTWKSYQALKEAMNVDITQEGLNIKGESFECTSKWKIYTKFMETPKLFMLYQSKNLFNLIPKRAFNSDEEIEEFRELLRTKIGTPR